MRAVWGTPPREEWLCRIGEHRSNIVPLFSPSLTQNFGFCSCVKRGGNVSARGLSVATIRRAELSDGETSMTAANDLAVRRALELAGVEFIDENGGGPGVRLRKRQRPNQTK